MQVPLPSRSEYKNNKVSLVPRPLPDFILHLGVAWGWGYNKACIWDQGPRRNRTLKHCCLCTGCLLLNQLNTKCISQYWYCMDWSMVFNTCWRYSDKSFFWRLQSPCELFLQKSVKATGADVPQAVLDYIRNNDVLILEGCDKVYLHRLEAYRDDLILYWKLFITGVFVPIAVGEIPKRTYTNRVFWRVLWCHG